MTDSTHTARPDAFAAFLSNRRPRVAHENLIHAISALTEEDVSVAVAHSESGSTIGGASKFSPIKTLRAKHHRIAQFLAVGTPTQTVAALCNCTATRVSMLQQDPAFVELLAHYTARAAEKVEESWADFHSVAADLSMAAMQELSERLDDEEGAKKFTPTHLMELVKLTADRTGHAPVNRNVNVNVNADIGSRLAAANARVEAERLRRLESSTIELEAVDVTDGE